MSCSASFGTVNPVRMSVLFVPIEVATLPPCGKTVTEPCKGLSVNELYFSC